MQVWLYPKVIITDQPASMVPTLPQSCLLFLRGNTFPVPLSPESLFATLGLGWVWEGSAKKGLKVKAGQSRASRPPAEFRRGLSAHGLHPQCLYLWSHLISPGWRALTPISPLPGTFEDQSNFFPVFTYVRTLNKTDGFLPARIFRFFTQVDAIVNL